MNSYRYFLLICLLLLIAQEGICQLPPAAVQDTSAAQDTVPAESSKVIVDHADLGEFIQQEDRQLQRLSSQGRQVELRQGNTFMYCDTAILENNNVTAFGNVIIQQGDTLSIFSDSLSYKGNEKIADLFGEVVLVNKDQKLFTNQLRYDMNTRIATYDQGAVLTNDTTQLISKIGYYHMRTNQAYFKDSVVVIDPEMSIRTDSLEFNTTTRITTFVGPTRITQDSAQIYCEAGFYNAAKKEAEFTKNAQYLKGEQEATAKIIRYNGAEKQVTLEGDARLIEGEKRATADRIRYQEDSEITWLEGNAHFEDGEEVIDADEIRYDSQNEDLKTSGRSQLSDPPQLLIADEIDYDGKLGKARGNVIWQDTSENTTVYCEVADYNKETDFLLAFGNRPLFVSIINDDSLFMRSDTLIALRESEEDSSRTMLAIADVRIFKSDLQAICDSLSYSTQDSLFQFFKDPVIWSDSSQFTADSIRLQLANNKIDRIFMRGKSFINNSPDEIFFNQIKGKEVTAFFAQDSIRRMLVEGNAESVYYALDDQDAYLGVNTTICSRMMLYFKNNTVDNIRFYTEPKGKFMPMEKAQHEALKLDGFRWRINVGREARKPYIEWGAVEKGKVFIFAQNYQIKDAMRSLVLFLLFCMMTAVSFAQQEQQQFEAANKLYNDGKFAEASQGYESLIAAGFQSAALYYNLGNCYYRAEDYGHAVLNYERALLLQPGDADIRHNLEEIQYRLKDDIEELPAFFLAEWWSGLRQSASVGTWSFLSILLLWLAVAGGFLWFKGAERAHKKYGFLGGMTFLFLGLLCFALAYSQYQLTQDSGQAIVMESSIKLRSAAAAESTILLTLHEGTKVDILDQIGEWYKINLANGDQGWLPTSAIEKI